MCVKIKIKRAHCQHWAEQKVQYSQYTCNDFAGYMKSNNVLIASPI